MKRILASMAAIVLLLSTAALSPTKAVTVNWGPNTQYNADINFCPYTDTVGQQPTEYLMDLTEWALEATWDTFDVNFHRAGCGLGDGDFKIRYVSFSEIGYPSVPMRTGISGLGGKFTNVIININKDYITEMWLSSSPDTGCLVGTSSGGGCKMDFVAMMVHEAGHGLGLAHATETGNLCASGYASTSWVNACFGNGLAIMNWEAGVEYGNCACGGAAHQGYRHGITTDERDAINAQY